MQKKDYLDQILGIICSVFDAYTGIIFLPDKNKPGMDIAARFSLGDHVRAGSDIKSGKGVVGWIVNNKQPLLINNYDRKRTKLGYYEGDEESKIKAFMGCPLAGGSGALCIDSKRTYSFSEKDQKILHLFAQLIDELRSRVAQDHSSKNEAVLYNGLTLLLTLHTRVKRWPQFLEQFLKLLSETTGFGYCLFASRDETGRSYVIESSNRPLFATAEANRSFSLGTGLVGWVFKNGNPVFTGDKDSTLSVSPLFGKDLHAPAFQSVVCLPLVVNKSTRGVLCLAHVEFLNMDEGLKSFCDTVAAHLTIFLDNLFVKSRLKALKARPTPSQG